MKSQPGRRYNTSGIGFTHQSYDDYWKAISVEEKFSRVKVPVHVHGGWFDLLLGGTLNGFVGMRKEGGTPKARKETKIIVGPWGHGGSQRFGDVDFGPTANRTLFDRNLQWFDHYLRGDDNGIDREPPVEIFYMGLNRWAHHDDWPIPGTRYTSFYISSGGHANPCTATVCWVSRNVGALRPMNLHTTRVLRCLLSVATTPEARRFPLAP